MKPQLPSAEILLCKQLHHLRNDLLAITLYSSCLASEAKEEGVSNEIAENTLEAARQMTHRLDELSLIFSSPDKSPILINPDHEICTILATKDFPQRDEVQLTQFLSGEDTQISLPRKAMRAILAHLIKNAFVATRNAQPQAQVSITTGIAADRWFLMVSDNGVGISSSPKTSGTGLNLISLLAETYGGTIALEPQEIGTRVTVSFPHLRPNEPS